MSFREIARLASPAPRARAARRRRQRLGGQEGYALLMVIFIAAVMIIMVAAATPNLLTQGKRAKEDEMIWRGEQYKRAVGLYYKKNGRFPTSVDDLVKGTPGVRYLRQAYKDPMNGTDGAWRLIYVTQAGQLVGSVRFTSLAQMAALLRPGAAQTAAGTQTGQPDSGAQGQQGSNPSGAPPNPSNPSASPQNPAASQGGPQPAPPAGAGTGLPLSGEQPQALGTGEVLGGNIIGVGSSIDKPSLKIYEGGTKYKQWEFIWNPLTVITLGQTGAIPIQPGQGPPGANPGAMPFINPNQNPTPNPPTPQPPQNPPPPM